LGDLPERQILMACYSTWVPMPCMRGGAALRILSELDCLPEGGYASKGSMIGILQGRIVEVPTDLTPEENTEWSKLMGGLGQIDTESIRSISLQEWAESRIHHECVRLFFYAMCRQWSYCDDMSLLSAGFVIKQGQLAGQGVKYVDRGWQTVVEDLHNAAVTAGATIATGYKTEQILLRDGRVHALLLSDGTVIQVSSIIAAAGPDETCRLVQGAEQMSIGRWKRESRPQYAACLDVALKNLPYPERVFALGLDEHLYFSKHSGSVKLSDLLHLLEPGWEREVVAIRFLPNILVAHDSRTIHHNGTGPAPGPAVPEVPGLFVAGDWVGSEGRLADAGMASAKLAAQEVLNDV
jgi:hypothetical protein